ncbi:MAG: tRNA-intron lyase [Candidatus Lokiarchaeota archaeon]|nr:tRNA-intron lyase [Candidatus Lokiarchaeota archaeon]
MSEESEVMENVQDEEEEEDPAYVIYKDGKGYVPKEESDRISQQGFYGTRLDSGELELKPIEILHLIERKRIVIATDDSKEILAKDIVSDRIQDDEDIWVKYLVFRDLRSRGYAVREGFGGGIDFRVYARGEKPGQSNANLLIYVMREGVAISLTDLDMVTEAASASRKKLIFALVDQNGEVNYYKVAQSKLKGETDIENE